MICKDIPLFLLRKLVEIKQREKWQKPIVFKRDPETETFNIFATINDKLANTYYSFYPDTLEID